MDSPRSPRFKTPLPLFCCLALAPLALRAAPAAAPTLLPGVVVPGAGQIDPGLGTAAYTVDAGQIERVGQGADATFNRVLLQAPGVSQDSAGQVHFREEDPYYQYYLNGVWLPAGINGFGQDLDPRFADSVSLKIGALPAEYAWGSYGVIDIQAKGGASPPGGDFSVYGGSYGTVHPSLSYAGAAGRTNVYASASYLHDNLGIENPTPSASPLHDTTNQYKVFGALSRQLTDTGRFSLIVSGSHADFQIPDNPGQAPVVEFRGREKAFPVANSALLNENQDEQTYYAVAAYQQAGPALAWQVAASSRYSSVLFRPDEPGDLYFDGVASRVQREILTHALQGDATSRSGGPHVFRAGLRLDAQAAQESDRTAVFAAEDDDVDPANGLTEVKGPPFTIPDDHFKHGYDASCYLQDAWSVSDRLTVNAGVRLDWTDAYVNESQLSPRLGVVWQATRDTVFHAGYARYFIPPPLESVSPASVGKFADTTNAADVTADDPVKCERSHYFDAGVVHDFAPGWQAALDCYYKRSVDQIDDGQFGAANIFSPYNFARARIYGVELSGRYARGGFSAFGNLAAAPARARGHVYSQFEFDPDELAYLSAHDIHPDQTQFFTGSAGLAYAWARTALHVDALYGSGIRAGFANLQSLPRNYPVSIGIVQRFGRAGPGQLTLRVDLVNLADQVYELNDGTGIGVGAPKYGNRRGLYAGLSRAF